jgi:spore germination protein GerM
MRRRPGLVVAALVAAVSAAGCGVSTESRPEGIDVTLVRVADRGTAEATARLDEPVRDIYLTRGRRLVRESRRVPAYSGIAGSLQALSRGPTAGEAGRGIGTALPSGAGPLTALVSDGVARVQLPESYGNVRLSEQVVAVAQIVYTVTSIDGINRVEFEIAGNPIEVPGDRGRLHDASVSRADYSSVAPIHGDRSQGPPSGDGAGHPRE